jgi:hypothetical protein
MCVLSRVVIALNTRVSTDKPAIFIVYLNLIFVVKGLVRVVHVRISSVPLPFKTILALLAINKTHLLPAKARPLRDALNKLLYCIVTRTFL